MDIFKSAWPKKFLLLTALLLSALVPAGENLAVGIPGKADQIVEREGYALGYCAAWKQARWVSYRLTAAEVLNQTTKRIDDFQPDPAILGGSATPEDYRSSGYDRGHLAPAADMKWSRRAMTECFYMSNMSPQNHGCNAGIWNEIENTVRGFACAEDRIFIVTGPVMGRNPKTIGRSRVAVPEGFYKVVYDETPPSKMIGFYVPNRNVPGKPRDYAKSVAEIERITGLVFFSRLPAAEQAKLKAAVNVNAWNWSKSQKRYTKTKRNVKTAPGGRPEYNAGSQMPVARRRPAPVCDKWPDTGYWLSTNSMKRHNRKCENYRKTRGYPCRQNEGSPCGKCGG